MATLSKILLTLIFFCLATIHFYWGLGGEWGMNKAIPGTNDGQLLFQPGPYATSLIGIMLLMAGVFYLLRLLNVNMVPWLSMAGLWVIPFLFMLRAIGDFKYVGFFKTIRQTNFGQLDTLLYSPLCLLIAVLGFLILFRD
ncbi:MAG: DUF3995 domain-containing protein [Bacteroidetes bacterium]|jgi:hypothetical protein|nr:DUF3995 domain-containing protein [Bacteroidota bacterium]